jgi:hypothetical protein
MGPASSAHMVQVDVGIVSRGLPDEGPGTVARGGSAGKSRCPLPAPTRLTLIHHAPNIVARMSIGLRSVAIRRSPDRRLSRGLIDDRFSAAVFDGLKARLDRLLREHTSSDRRGYAAGLREALLEAKVGLTTMREALLASERELEAERKQLEDAERRGRLAAAVPDAETVALAERFAERHRVRIEVLVRKIAVQHDELALAQREIEEMANQYRAAAGSGTSNSVDAAWRDLEAAGGTRPNAEDRVQQEVDQHRLQKTIDAQLAYLKKKMGRDNREK